MSKERTARTAIPRGSKASQGKKPSATKYPKADRSDQVRHRTKDADGSIDIGWAEGTLKDGRPYVAELWAEDQLTLMVLFISKKGIPSLGRDASARLLEENGLVTFLRERYCSARSFIDAAGNPMWSINLVIGDEDELYAKSPILFFPYVYPLGAAAEKPKATPTRLVGTILSDVGGVQTVAVQDAPANYLESFNLEGKQRAVGGKVGDRVNLTHRTTATYAMWFGKVAK